MPFADSVNWPSQMQPSVNWTCHTNLLWTDLIKRSFCELTYSHSSSEPTWSYEASVNWPSHTQLLLLQEIADGLLQAFRPVHVHLLFLKNLRINFFSKNRATSFRGSAGICYSFWNYWMIKIPCYRYSGCFTKATWTICQVMNQQIFNCY